MYRVLIACYDSVMTTLVSDRPKRRVYLGNLFRFRAMYAALFLGILLALLLSWAGAIGAGVGFFGGYALIMWYYVGIQMVCHNCATKLRAVRTRGNQMVCHKCGMPTDHALALQGHMR